MVHLQHLVQAYPRQGVLIEQILTFSRMDARKERVEFETTSVHRVIEEVTSLIKPMADEKKLDFEAIVDAE